MAKYHGTKYRAGDPTHQAHSRRAHQRRLLAAMRALGLTCAACGEPDIDILQIDHLGAGCDERRNLHNGQVLRRVVEHPEDYQLLCGNCHHRKSWPNRFKDVPKEELACLTKSPRSLFPKIRSLTVLLTR